MGEAWFMYDMFPGFCVCDINKKLKIHEMNNPYLLVNMETWTSTCFHVHETTILYVNRFILNCACPKLDPKFLKLASSVVIFVLRRSYFFF